MSMKIVNEKPIVTLICAKAEWNAVKKIMKTSSLINSPFGECFSVRKKETDQEIIFFYTGCGKTNASAATQYVIDNYEPEFLMNLGTCGGFQGETKIEDLFTVTETAIYDIFEQPDNSHETEENYRTKLDISWVNTKLFPIYFPTIMVSADKDLVSKDIPVLKKKYNAIAADWESASIAYVASKNKIKCLIQRGVSDVIDDNTNSYDKEEIIKENTEKIMKRLINDLDLSLS